MDQQQDRTRVRATVPCQCGHARWWHDDKDACHGENGLSRCSCVEFRAFNLDDAASERHAG